MANPANRFHTWVYRARPDINCIIHTHATHSVALAMLERPLKIAFMDVCVLYDDVAFLPIWTGVPVGNEEGKVIAETLADKRAMLLAHHGLLVTGTHGRGSLRRRGDVRTGRRACSLSPRARATIKDIEPALGQSAHDWILQEKRSQATFHYYARQFLRSLPRGDGHPLS